MKNLTNPAYSSFFFMLYEWYLGVFEMEIHCFEKLMFT